MSYVNIRDASVYKLFGETARIRLPIIGKEIVGIARATCNYRTGALAASIEDRYFWAPIFPSVSVWATTSYAVYVHEGTGAHRIDGNPLLIFRWRERGGVRFVGRSVNHPGYGGNPFLRNAMFAVVGR